MMLSWQMTNPPTASTTSWWPCRPAETRYRRWTSMACAFGAWLGSRSARRWLWLCGWGRTSLPVVTLLTSNDEWLPHCLMLYVVSNFRIIWDMCVATPCQTTIFREPNQQGFQRSRAMGGETHFFHPSTDTKQEIAVMCESTCPVVVADAHLLLAREKQILLPLGSLFCLVSTFLECVEWEEASDGAR